MSETIINEIPSLNGLTTETDSTVNETGVHNEDDETWLYGSRKMNFNQELNYKSCFFLFIDNNPNNEENMSVLKVEFFVFILIEFLFIEIIQQHHQLMK